ncbi:uncharacterized protein LOC120705103 isoform X2 [Panicum virgatum]|uniref:Uncharacterized protein n=1 Tax=Panicum virgatum TaxID=38727 RepID=A0A8T0TR48_PANVG|nr:uncharacterized protein LOC120705103 isoform X2 [Panicum virgatum]KAG2611266.1 hypothetical protein PVAP13_4KG132500 [Panicum virgatum]
MRTGLNSVHPLAHSVEQAVGDAVQTEVASLLFAVLAHAVVETDAADSCNAAKRKMRTGEAKTMLTSMKSKCSSPIAVYLRGRASHGSGVAAEPPRRHTSCSTAGESRSEKGTCCLHRCRTLLPFSPGTSWLALPTT